MDAVTAFDAIAFDLDGTLVDSAPDISHALNTALREAGLRSFDLHTVRAWIGDGPDVLIGHALAAQGHEDVSPELRRRLRAAFDAVTLAAPLGHGVVFEGIEAVLMQLARVMPLVVVTNKPTPLAAAVLAAARLLPHVCSVHGADTPEQRKPSPLLLQAAARRLGLPTNRMLMVGDGPADVGAARAAGCAAALVDWGYAHAAVDSSDARLWRLRSPEHLLGGMLLDTAAARH
ncbi:HAD-IA family hydrolase [Piscinibacter sp.]|jgi:phosphoglycolate phosphatase|uniref:HAD-IA family hydrolase n=1 Tax=Piscinibacter sp. TaxID=1903157 RepID=UPI002F404715